MDCRNHPSKSRADRTQSSSPTGRRTIRLVELSHTLQTGLVISDLHLFSHRSVGEDLILGLQERLNDTKILVLNGDTFDFRWSKLSNEEQTLEAAQAWLDQLIIKFPHLELHYVLGNHDCLQSFREILDQFTSKHPRFHLHEYTCRLGSNLFLHGDCTNWGMTAEKLIRYRQAWSKDSPKGPLSKSLYRLVDLSGLGYAFHHLYFRRTSTIARIERYLGPEVDGITHCFFGHTHVPFENHLQNSITFANTGSGIKGMGFLPQPFEYSAS